MELRSNLLNGQIPDWIAEMKSLKVLDLSANNLSGRIPTSMGDVSLLKELNLSNNYFVGSLPRSLMKCNDLVILDIGNNFLTGNLPSWTFELGVESISLSGNRFTGHIDYPSISMDASYRSLQVLDLSSNALSGEIPAAIWNISSLQVLNISRNFLSGTIPEAVAERKSFEWYNSCRYSELLCSKFIGLVTQQPHWPYPSEIAKLTILEVVDFSFNQFSGSLPKELTNLSHLATFNVSHNHLKGELPVGGFFNTISPSSVVGNPSLCGSVLNHSCPAVHPKPLVLNPNSSDPNHASVTSLGHKRIMLSISSLIALEQQFS
ncbi:hypothetical protein KY290_036438 [Solanum tuberosum]|uniref:Uncharacterized protein n=1 Tax=Solanum tuberosum TaxID=4113 RepID=A0ABQ7TUN5_SOLTU|nr:hypothetical protein KY290_036438 [Solanum tuberosum]